MISFSYLSIRRIRVVRLPFFSEISRPQKKVFPRRSESILTCKPALLRSDFPCSSVAAGVTPAILRLLRVAGQFGREQQWRGIVYSDVIIGAGFAIFVLSRRRSYAKSHAPAISLSRAHTRLR